MNSAVRERVKDLLSQAARMAPDARRPFIEQAAGDNAEVARDALELLKTLDDTAFMASPTNAGVTVDAGMRTHPADTVTGMRIGRYKLLHLIGEGGFGTVYQAEQTEPVVRRVALKIVKPGMDSREVIARFDAERQAVAMMDHPNIARVHDAGQTQDGRPYFVMELVRGESITSYCDREQLSVAQRLGLLHDVCLAVQHAHQKGIIHRDIKPRNVMVTVVDDKPVPKVIDFGIAKATQARLTEHTLFTELNQFIGTPEYMSPEQADTASADIDTRSDIYSLGVLLYELLTGTTPFGARRLFSQGYAGMVRILRDEAPQRPSQRLKALEADSRQAGLATPPRPEPAATIAHIARCRRLEAPHLQRALSGELDWIAMKCLEKERGRRYDTAAALAEELQCYLARRPIRARPPTISYRLAKFAERNRAWVTVGVAGAFMLAASIIALATFALQASAAHERERQERLRAEKSLVDTQRHRRRAEENAEEARQVANFQAKMLSAIDINAMGQGVKEQFRKQVRAAIKRAGVGEWPNRHKPTAEEVKAKLAEFDAQTAAVQSADVARGLIDKYVLRPARSALKDRFADNSLTRATIQLAVADAYQQLGLFNPAATLMREALQTRRDHYGDDHPLVASTLNALAGALRAKGDLAAAAEALQQAESIGRRHASGAALLDILQNQASLQMERGNLEQAESLFREALDKSVALPKEHRARAAEIRIRLAAVLVRQSRLEDAEGLCREGLEELEGANGVSHGDMGRAVSELAQILHSANKHAAAEPLFQKALDLLRADLGAEHWEVGMAIMNLANVKQGLGDFSAAESLYREALAVLRRAAGPEHISVAMCLGNMSITLKALGNLAESVSASREALRIRRMVLGDESDDVAKGLNNLAMALKDQHNFVEAESMYREALAINRKLYGDSHESVGRTLNHIALLLILSNRLDEAMPACQAALAANQKFGNHPGHAVSLNNLATLHKARDELAEAEPLYREALAVNRSVYAADHPAVATSLANLGSVLLARGDANSAEPMFREALDIYLRRLPEHHDQVILARVNLGWALSNRGQFAQAEALLQAAEESMTKCPNLRADTTLIFQDAALAHYTAWNAQAPTAERAQRAEHFKSLVAKSNRR